MASKDTEHSNLRLKEAQARKPRQSASNPMGAGAGPEIYELRPRKDGDGFDLTSDGFRYGPIWYAGPDAISRAVAYAKFRSLSRSRGATIHVLDHSDILIEAR
jgi:hypothetical protein